MISIKRYLDSREQPNPAADESELQSAMRSALRSIFTAMGNASVEALAATGNELRSGLALLEDRLAVAAEAREVASTENEALEQLSAWGARSAEHQQARTGEVKGMLLVLAETAERLANRDTRCAEQLGEVTTQLRGIASLDDLKQIRASIERTAVELRSSVDRISEEGRHAVEHLRREVKTYQAKLEAAEYVASCDALTSLGNRVWIESQLNKRMEAGTVFSAVVLDLDDFKTINDTYGHLAGDEVLKQFATELKSACRSSDVVGRWGGDEFIVLLDGSLDAARVQVDRLRQWVCGTYTIPARSGEVKLKVCASIGLAEYKSGETLKQLLERADAAMYAIKSETRGRKSA